MIHPEKFNLETDVAFFISNLWIVMNFIFFNKIINYNYDTPAKYDSLSTNSRIKENLQFWPITKEYFSLLNSIDKITWNNFVTVVKIKFPDFNETEFLKNCQKNFSNFNNAEYIFVILIFDSLYNAIEKKV